MIKNIIFDWGGVCTYGHLLEDFSKKLAGMIGHDAKTIENAFRELEYPYETGVIPPDIFWRQFKEKLHLGQTIEELQSVFYASYDLNKDVLNLVGLLRSNYNTVLLTNNYEDMFTYIRTHYELDQYFEQLYSSSGIKRKKPEMISYTHVMNKLGIKPEEAVFIDDKEKNVAAAKQRGMHTIHFKNIKQLEIELQALGVSTK